MAERSNPGSTTPTPATSATTGPEPWLSKLVEALGALRASEAPFFRGIARVNEVVGEAVRGEVPQQAGLDGLVLYQTAKFAPGGSVFEDAGDDDYLTAVLAGGGINFHADAFAVRVDADGTFEADTESEQLRDWFGEMYAAFAMNGATEMIRHTNGRDYAVFVYPYCR